MNSEGLFTSLMSRLGNFFGSISETYDILVESMDLPMRLSSYMPAVIGASITIVLCTMVIKFIIGR